MRSGRYYKGLRSKFTFGKWPGGIDAGPSATPHNSNAASLGETARVLFRESTTELLLVNIEESRHQSSVGFID